MLISPTLLSPTYFCSRKIVCCTETLFVFSKTRAEIKRFNGNSGFYSSVRLGDI